MVRTKPNPFLADLHIRAPTALAEAIERAAYANMTSSSEYIRQAILARLKADSYAPADTATGARHGRAAPRPGSRRRSGNDRVELDLGQIRTPLRRICTGRLAVSR